MTSRSFNTKLNGKDSLLTRKAEKFRAILSESENSDDEFKDNRSKKPSARTESSKKLKKTKLKLGGKGKPQESSGVFTNIKSSSPATETSQVNSSCIDMAVREPDSAIHHVSSQETVVLSSCECTSSQDLSESDGENHCSSTLPLLTAESTVMVLPTLKKNESDGSVSEIIGRQRHFKRKVIEDEDSIVEVKKTRTDHVDIRKIISFPCSRENSNQDDEISQLSDKLESLKEDIKVLVKVGGKTSKMKSKQDVTRLTPTNKGSSEVSPSQKATTEIPKGCVSKESTPTKKKLKETLPSSKSQKPLKNSRPTKTKVPEKDDQNNTKYQLRETTEEMAKRDREGIDNQMKPAEATEAAVNSHTPISTRSEKIAPLIHRKEDRVLKQQSLPKQRVKAWNPPGRALGQESTPSSSPSTGRLRLGLSRKRLSKPLHPEVKPKYC